MKAIGKIPNMVSNKKFQKIRNQRRQQLKHVVSDISKIAIQEIERFNTFAEEMLSEQTDNPIVLQNEQEYDEKEGI